MIAGDVGIMAKCHDKHNIILILVKVAYRTNVVLLIPKGEQLQGTKIWGLLN